MEVIKGMGRRLVRRSQCASWGSGKSEVGFSEGAGENGRKSAFRGTSCQDRGQQGTRRAGFLEPAAFIILPEDIAYPPISVRQTSR